MSEERPGQQVTGRPEDKEALEYHLATAASAGREEYVSGQATVETLRTTSRPDILRKTLRAYLRDFENPERIIWHSPYNLPRILEPLEDRERVFSLTLQDLKDDGHVREGEKGLEAVSHGYALRVEKKEVQREFADQTVERVEEFNADGTPRTDKEGQPIVKIIRRTKTRTTKEFQEVPYFGTDEERREMAKTARALLREATARQKIHELYKGYLNTAGSLGEMSKLFLTPLYYYPHSSDYDVIFNLPATFETGSRPELKGNFGDKQDLALMAKVIIALSERPKELKRYRNTLRWKTVFPDTEAGREAELHWVGDVSSWQEDRTKANFLDEVRSGVRGRLTRYGNIYTRRESAWERKALRDAATEFSGGEEAAEELADRFFHMSGIAGELGGQDFTYSEMDEVDDRGRVGTKAGQYKEKPNVEGHPAADDWIKLLQTARWHRKQAESGHAHGPDDTVGHYPQLMVNLLKFINCYMERDERGAVKPGSRRSFWELWWNGYNNQHMTLGSMPWVDEKIKINMEVQRDHLLRTFLGGREEVGLLDKLMKTKWSPQELANKTFWEKMNLDINVLVNDQLVTGGRFEGLTPQEISEKKKEWKKKIKDAFWKGIRYSPENEGWVNTTGGAGEGSAKGRETIKKYQNLAGFWD